VHYCSFVMAAVQSEETESWGTEFDAEVFEIPALQLASFAAIPDERQVDEDITPMDITPMDTNNTPQVDIQGLITHARARQLNLQVISFLRNYSCAFESSMLPNDLIILRN
jgi:hypothetical protein